jgi:myo-inositol-1(or 4)-monophosphatase
MPDFMDVCVQAVHAGGEVLLEKLGQVAVRAKGPADLVTEADFAAQESIRRTVLGAFRDHGFLGEEEEAAAREASSQGGYRWIVDPLDGTTNYVHQVPHFSVSLALERAGELIVGAVYNPVSQECFTAARGEGARLNGRPIRTSTVSALSESLCAVGLPAAVKHGCRDMQVFLATVGRCHGLRRTGSNALNMAYVAAGRFDAAWSFSTKIWDIAAGALLIREAGGMVASPDGQPLWLEHGHYLAAATPALFAELVAISGTCD